MSRIANIRSYQSFSIGICMHANMCQNICYTYSHAGRKTFEQGNSFGNIRAKIDAKWDGTCVRDKGRGREREPQRTRGRMLWNRACIHTIWNRGYQEMYTIFQLMQNSRFDEFCRQFVFCHPFLDFSMPTSHLICWTHCLSPKVCKKYVMFYILNYVFFLVFSHQRNHTTLHIWHGMFHLYTERKLEHMQKYRICEIAFKWRDANGIGHRKIVSSTFYATINEFIILSSLYITYMVVFIRSWICEQVV